MVSFLRTLAAVALLAAPALACEIQLVCPHHGQEMRRDFVVTVRHLGKPLPGASVTVIAPGIYAVPLTGETGPEGTIQFNDLPAGNYDLSVEKLGISTIYTCFHVSKWKTGLKARRTLTFDWGNDAPATKELVGRVLGSQRYGNFKDVVSHHADTPLAATVLTLWEPFTNTKRETRSDPDGKFSFGGVPEGTYVLQTNGDNYPTGPYFPGAVAVRVSATAARNTLLLWRSSQGADCSAPLELVN